MSIFILDNTDKSFFPINNSVSVCHYQLSFGIGKNGNVLTRKIALFKHIHILKKKIVELSPDLIIGTEYHFTIVAGLAMQDTKIPVFGWEHHHFHWIKRNRFWNFLHRKIYPRINAVVTLNETEKQLFINYGCKAVVIPNFISQQTKAQLDNPVLLSVGWLNWRKGIDLIPAIAKKVFEKYPAWRWNIIGSGENKNELEKSLIEKQLNNNVRVIEPVSGNISEEYKQVSIYVMTSRFECFPMVLLEAMSFGVPCISFDCSTGPGYIIKNGIDGILIENENINAIADAIIELIKNEEKRKQLGANAFENIKRFSPETVYQLWERLFNDDKNF